MGQKQTAVEAQELPLPMCLQATPRDFPTALGPTPPLPGPPVLSFANSSRPIQESVVQPPQDVQGSDQIKSHPVLPTQASGHDQTKQLHAHLVDPHWSHQVLPISSPCSSREPVLPNGAKEENSNSQREGRQNPFKMDEKNKQEPKAKKQPAMETPELHPPMSLQAMPCDLPTALGPSQTPAAEGNQTVGAMPFCSQMYRFQLTS